MQLSAKFQAHHTRKSQNVTIYLLPVYGFWLKNARFWQKIRHYGFWIRIFSYIFLFSNPFCTCVPNFKHIPYIKVKLWPYLCRKYSDFDWKMLRFTQKSAIMDFFQIFFLTSKILQQSGQIETKSKSIPPFYPQLWSKVLVILKNAIFHQFLCFL